MLADAGEAIGDSDVLRHQSGVLGPVASPATVWVLDEVTPGRLRKIQTGRARTRRHVWALLGDGVPASRVAGTDLGEAIVLDVDATIVIAHSEKENAAATFKRSFGFHPLGVWFDNTSEFLAAKLRPGNAGSNTAADHIEVLADAIAQIPAAQRKQLLIRSDGAGASHALLDWLSDQGNIRGRRLDYSVGFAVNGAVRDAISLLPDQAWTPASDADGGVRDAGDVAELTGLLELTGWPGGMRLIALGNDPTPARNCPCSRRRTGGATRGSSRTHPPASWRSWRHGTAPTPGSRTGSVTPRIRAWDASPPASTASTRPG
jgi:Transposase DDE domain group 1